MCKVFHLISSPAAGGAEVFVKNIAIEMSRAGSTQIVLFLRRSKDIGRDQEYEDKFLEELKVNNVKYIFLHGRAIDIFKNRVLAKRIIKEFTPDIIHLHMHHGIPIFFGMSVPLIYTHHTVKPKFLRFGLGKLLKKYIKFVALSKANEEMLTSAAGSGVVRIDNGVRVPVDAVSMKKQSSILTIVSVGRLCYEKDYPKLIRILSRVKKRVSVEFTMSIYGEGEIDDIRELEDYIAEHDLTDVVFVRGQSNDIYKELSSSDIFVMTSRSEGLPIALLEATSYGLPVLVTDVGGCGEVVERCKNGFVVCVDDEVVFSDYLVDLLESGSLRAQLGKMGVENVKYYSITRCAQEHLDLYSEMSGEDVA